MVERSSHFFRYREAKWHRYFGCRRNSLCKKRGGMSNTLDSNMAWSSDQVSQFILKLRDKNAHHTIWNLQPHVHIQMCCNWLLQLGMESVGLTFAGQRRDDATDFLLPTRALRYWCWSSSDARTDDTSCVWSCHNRTSLTLDNSQI